MLLSDIYLLFSSLSCCLVHDNSKQEKDYALLLSFVGQARLQFAGLHSLFLALWCTVIEIDGAMMDLLFWDLMYLYPGFICCLRCHYRQSLYLQGLIFIVADAFFKTDVSATYFSLNLQILFSLPVMYNCIYIVPFLGFEDAFFENFASTSHVFDNLRMFLIEIVHPQLALSITCGYTSQKLCQYIPYKKIDIRNSSEYGVSNGDT